MNSHPPISTTQHALRFGDLPPGDFERLCLELLQRENHEWQQVQHYGLAGQEQGRDLVAQRHGKCWVVQCKRYQTISSKTLKEEVDKCLTLTASLRPHGILFITSAEKVTTKTRDAVAAYCQKHGFACEIWARTELSGQVSKHPQLVAQFFGAASAPMNVTMNAALHQVAEPVQDFVGRVQELADLTQHLQPNPQHSQTVAIAGANGAGGIGKTELARKLVSELREAYPDAQLFINLRGVTFKDEKPATPAEALQQFIRALEPAAQAAQLPESVSELRGIYLSRLKGRRALIVCDNARDRAQVEPLIPPAGCALILTSRVAMALPRIVTCHLDKLAADEAIRLLQSIVRHLSDAEATRLAALCGYFPQALRVYGNFLAERPDYPAERYAARIAQAQARGELEPEIAAAFATSYEELLNAAQQQHWRQLAVFVSDFDAAAAAAVWQLEADEAFDMLSELARLSLIESDTTRHRYHLHDLARVYAQGLLAADERYASEVLYAAHYCDVLRVAHDLYLHGQPLVGLQRYDTEATHISAGFEWAKTQMVDGTIGVQLCLQYPDAWFVLSLRLHSREQIEWFSTQLTAARQAKARKIEGNALGNLGLAYANLGEIWDALACYEQSLTISREIGDLRSTSAGLGNMGVAYLSLGDLKKAVHYFEEDLAITRTIGDRRGEGQTLSNLGFAYVKLNDLRQAIGYFENALVIARTIGDRRGEGNALGNLGIASFELGEVKGAVEYYQQQLLIACEIGDRTCEANANWNMALALHSQGETERARTLADMALQLFEVMDLPNAAAVRDGLAKWEAAE